jgi:Fur family transcriptional regulator, ferric uptake regulator
MARLVAEHGKPAADAELGSAAGASRERSTRQKRALAALLGDIDTFRTAQDLHQLLQARGERVGLTTVYNQLRALADAGEVDVLRSESGEALYRRCRTESHHHHLLCRRCGRTVEIEGPNIEAWASDLAHREGYTDVAHTVEIVGTCSDCRSLRRRATR